MFFSLLLGNLVMILSFLFKAKSIPPQIPLFYSRPWGQDQIADRWLLIIIPLLMNFFYFLNIAIRKKFFPKEEFLKKVVSYLNVSLIILFSAIFLKIIFIVT